jgi:hypothetical protein
MQRRKWTDEETVNGTKKEARKTQRRQRKRREMKRVCYVSCCGKVALTVNAGKEREGKTRRQRHASGNWRRSWFNKRYLLKLVGVDGAAKGVEKICEDNHLFIYIRTCTLQHTQMQTRTPARIKQSRHDTKRHKNTHTHTHTHTHTGSGSLEIVGVDIIGMFTIIGANGGANIGAGASPGLGA